MRICIVIALVIGCGPNDSRPPDASPDANEGNCLADEIESCARDGQLCEDHACVDPWRYGSPQWSRCEGESRATAETLAEKAAIYDARATSLHMHPQMPWVVDVVLQPGTNPETATAADVASWWSGENDGLFSGLVFASQAYRYGATGDPAALAALERFMDGEEQRMRITGVRGLFARQIIPPNVDGIACPTDLAEYTPTPDKRGNKWVRIGGDGCAQVVDAGTSVFRSTTHCGLDEFAGWCFKDNPSQDEYVGHALALNALARVLYDRTTSGQPTTAELRLADRVQDMRGQIHHHLAQNDNVFVDWDGRQTQWGKLYPGAPGDTRGYLAVVGLGVQSMGVLDRTLDYTPPFWQSREDWVVELDEIDQWDGPDGCEANWNNLAMLTASFSETIHWPHSLDGFAPYRQAFADSLAHPIETSRGILAQHNAWWQILWAIAKPLGPGTDGPAYAAVEDAVCQLKQFPRSNHQVAKNTAALAPHACTDRLDNSLGTTPFEIADRCAATFAYWGNPYERSQCDDRHELVRQPGSYLLPYWMGRYFGFIPPDL
jgi:hypothetical protein